MKILHVLSSPHLGGAEVMCLLLAKAQMFAGHDVLVHLMEGGATQTYAESESVPIVLREADKQTGKRDYWNELNRLLRQTVAGFKPDLVHSHVPKTNLVCHRTLPELKIPWTATIHGSWKLYAYSPSAVKRPLLKPYLLLRHAAGDFLSTRSASRIVAISDYVKGQLLQIGVSRKKLRVVHDGLPFNPGTISRDEARARFNIAPDAFVIGSLGHLSPVKGFDLLIDAFARLAPQFENSMLLIAGGGVLGDNQVRNLLQEQIDCSGLSKRVRLLDTLDTRQGFLGCLDLFAVASRTEGFSLALVEAMQHGLASVVTSAGGCLEAARPGEESLVFTSGNVGHLADQLRLLIKDSELRAKLGSSAQIRAQNYLTLNRCAAEYEKVYEEVNSITLT
ncbi:glycosyltransferase family 4 protein [bacterium]|nr:glycosyltransferase family 4 protein [bacterium]MBU1636569.1 glycosyltransferase family 4 protein [bacterium]MBU1921066.1 glycosyltransferase family 4 protein [bacterium]